MSNDSVENLSLNFPETHTQIHLDSLKIIRVTGILIPEWQTYSPNILNLLVQIVGNTRKVRFMGPNLLCLPETIDIGQGGVIMVRHDL